MTTSTFTRADEIAETFALVKKVHPSKLALPCITYRFRAPKKESYQMSEAIADSIWQDSKAHKALMDALHHSTCPHVAALLQVISDEYTDKNADALELYDEERGQ